MNTRFIGIKEFRQNISSFAEKAQQQKDRFVVMNRNKPLFEIKAFSPEADLNTVLQSIMAAQNDIEKGDVYSHKEMMDILS